MSDESKLPEGWIKCKSKKRPNKNYYFNKLTGETSWSNPNSKNPIPTPRNAVVGSEPKLKLSEHIPPPQVLKLQKPKKNLASDRLKRLQNNLKTNQLKNEHAKKTVVPPPQKKTSTPSTTLKLAAITPPTSLKVIPHPAQKRKFCEEVTPLKKAKEESAKAFLPIQTSSPLPTLKKPEVKHQSPKLSPIASKSTAPSKGIANARLQELQVSLEKQQRILSDDILMQQPTNESSNAQCSEDMDWEPSDLYSSCVSEISDNNNDNGTMSEYYDCFKENSFKVSSNSNQFDGSYSFTDFYFVVDTNVLLNNLTFVEDLSKKVFGGSINAIIMIPYKVIQELDGLKNRESTATLAIRAIKLLNDKLASKDPHFQGQNVKHSKEELIPFDTNDDEILNCCLQILKSCKNVMLISHDVNLRNKAIVNDIKVLNTTKPDVLESDTILNLMNSGSQQI